MQGIAEPSVALIAVTKPGALQVRGLAQRLPRATVVVAAGHAALMDGLANQVIAYPGALSGRMAGLFSAFDQLVFFLSVGAVVRLIAPHLGSKYQDPGVLVIDSAARFVIPVLSGHVGGANAYAERLAALLGATAVITTASEGANTIAVDILGRELGWRLEAPKPNLTRVAARVVDGEAIALVQEAGARDWWSGPGPLPENIHLYSAVEAVDPDRYSGVLLVTRRAIPADLWQRLAGRLVVYRPPAGQP
ncbi:cobalamin biosynthesis central domain-containing protein [Candidatus Thiosymbion oneisti]|uniref:cobalamin biosynthesis central domain-containing protein n=1 Tax=Candidatus Thiosymbion oneisti TaxID=589554 RepID=UPI000A4EA31C